MRIYQNRRLPTGRRKLWMHCTRSPRAGIPYRHKGMALQASPHRNAFRDHIVAFHLVLAGAHRHVPAGKMW
jgi:hypothetical protein